MPLIFSNNKGKRKSLLLSVMSSIIFDYFVRQKLGGVNMTFGYVRQFPILAPIQLLDYEQIILPKIVELLYTSWDIKAFADDLWREADDDLKAAIREQWENNKQATGGHVWELPEWVEAYPEIDWDPEKNGGCPLPPFKWDEERRALLRAELDAWYALLYGLERDELRYILDPKEVHGEDFPGETFRVLKEKEIRQYGEYRTHRLVLEAYDRLRPDWDMEAHLDKLKEVWEECQKNRTAEYLSKKKYDIKNTSSQVNEDSDRQYGGLFDQ